MYEFKDFPTYFTDGYDVFSSRDLNLVRMFFPTNSKYPALWVRYPNNKLKQIRVHCLKNYELTDNCISFIFPNLYSFTEVSTNSNYLIDRHGKVWSKEKRKFLKPRLDDIGYLGYCLVDGKQHKNCRMHRLIAENFIPNPNAFNCVDHINRIRTDNRISNLRWVSYSQNNYNAVRNIRIKLFKGGIEYIFPNVKSFNANGFNLNRRKTYYSIPRGYDKIVVTKKSG